MITDETAMRLLHATREQLYGKPAREIKPLQVAEKAGINLTSASTPRLCDT
jgi:hypothetical protein